jgi:hypothetical protein
MSVVQPPKPSNPRGGVPWWRKVDVKKDLKKKKDTKVLPFRAPLEQRGDWITIFSLGDRRFAVRWEAKELPPAAPVLEWKQTAKKAAMKVVE